MKLKIILSVLLLFSLLKVDARKATLVFIEFFPCIDDARLQIAFIIEKFADLFDIFYAIYFQVVYYLSLIHISRITVKILLLMWLNILVTNNLLLKESIPLKGLKSKVSVGRQGEKHQ